MSMSMSMSVILSETINKYGEITDDWKGLNKSPYTGKGIDDKQQHNGEFHVKFLDQRTCACRT